MELCPFRAACKIVRLVENLAKHPFHFQNWGKAPCAFAGCRGGASPCKSAKASSRGTKCHGVRDERPLQDLRSSRKTHWQLGTRLSSQRAKRTSVQRRSRPWLTQKGEVFLLLYAEITKMKIFLLPAFYRLFAPFLPVLLGFINFK